MSKRHRVLFIAEAVTLAHVARASVLARCLDPARFEVHAAWDPRYNALLGALPFPFSPIHTLSGELFLRRLARGAPMHDARTLRSYVEEDLATIRRVGPDVVVGDFRLSLAASARIVRVPLVSIANAYWSPYGKQTFIFPEYDYPLSGMLGAAVARVLFRALRPLGFAAHTRPLNLVLREHKLPGVGHDLRTMYTAGDFTAYADIPSLMKTEGLPSNHRYIGPVIWSPASPPPDWWATLPGDRPVIYATPGSSGDVEALQAVLDGLADLPVTVIAASAGRARPQRVPSNAYLADYLDGSAAAARAALVICNGGSPTTYQALAAGVPVLGLVTNNMDQQLNMEAVQEAGAGRTLRARGLAGSTVRDVVTGMLSGAGYTEAARKAQLGIAALRAEVQFPLLLEDVLAGSGGPKAPTLSSQDVEP